MKKRKRKMSVENDGERGTWSWMEMKKGERKKGLEEVGERGKDGEREDGECKDEEM